ncbi:hypothetical protein ABRP17_016685 [Stenotrophomonas sp. WHRI 8082]|uniref:hypothetical protein n=1 Tax=Stenotrophomonas sp. WHRI 8082 TaxID=3162571 RepID=UPI0032EEAAF7
MEWTREEMQVFLNENLLKENLGAVVQELQEMRAGRGMIAANHDDSLLQGDVYDKVPCVLRAGGELKLANRRVLLLSNSCDASTDNPRHLPLDLTVAPLMRLDRYAQMLLDKGVSESAVADITSGIRKQEKTNLIYIPVGALVKEEMVALLDRVQSLSIGEFQAAAPSRLAVLTQRGFWILLVKLSMHFLRPHEGVGRTAA